MAIEDVQGIVDSIHKAYARRLESQRLAQEQANQEGMRDEAKQRIDIERQRFKDEAEHRRAEDEMRRAASKTAHLDYIQKMSAAAERGEPVPNAIISPNALDPTKQIFTIPNDNPHLPPDVVDTRTPNEYYKQMDAREEALHGTTSPRFQADMAKTAAREAGIAAQKKEDDDRRDERLYATLDSQNKRAAAERAVQMYHFSQAMKGLKPSLDPNEVMYNHDEAYKGNLTLKEAKQKLNSDQFNQVRTAMDASGTNFYTDKQKELKSHVAAGVSLIPDMTRIEQLIKEHPPSLNPSSVLNPLSDAGVEFGRLRDQVGEKLVSVLNVLGQGSRLSEPRVKIVKDAFGPSKFVNADLSNGQAKKAFLDIITDVTDASLQGLSQEQKNDFKTSLNLPLRTPTGAKTTAPPNAAPKGAAPMSDEQKKLLFSVFPKGGGPQ